MKSIYLFFTVALSLTVSVGQTPKKLADSIIQANKVKGIDSVLVTKIAKDFFKYCYSNPEVARHIADGAIDLGKSIGSELLESRSQNLKGIYYDVTGKADSAIVQYNTALKTTQKNQDFNGEASVLNNLGLIYWNKEELQKAMNYYVKSLKIFEGQKNINGQASNLNNIGLILTDLDRSEEAIKYHKKSLKKYQTIDNTYGIGSTYTNISRGFFALDQADSSIFYNKLAIKTKQASGDVRGLGITYNHIGGDYVDAKKLDSAEYYLKEADAIYRKLNDKRLIITNAKILSEVYFDQKKYKDALTLSKKTYTLLSDEEIYSKFTVVSQIADNYGMLGQYEEASQQYVYALRLKDSIMAKKIEVETNEVFEKYQSAEKEKKILVQRTELAEKELKISKQNTQLLGLGALILILGILGYLLYNQQKLKNKQLLKENELKDALLKIETQNRLQEQRLRISRDLHDNIGAQLTFIISSIDNLKYGFKIEDSKLTNKLSSISAFTKDTIYELRDTIWAMNKSEITFDDLESRISNFIEKADLASTNTCFIFNTEDDNLKDAKLTSVEGMNMYRIIQEAVNNAIKYADASKISVTISAQNNKLELTVLDNGKGYDTNTESYGNGINNMKKRASELNAEIIFTSEENKGTTIKLHKAINT